MKQVPFITYLTMRWMLVGIFLIGSNPRGGEARADTTPLSMSDTIEINDVDSAFSVTPYLRVISGHGELPGPVDDRQDVDDGVLSFVQRVTHFSYRRDLSWMRLRVRSKLDRPLDYMVTVNYPVADFRVVDAKTPAIALKSGYQLGDDMANPSILSALPIVVKPGLNTFFVGVDAGGRMFLPVFEMRPAATYGGVESFHSYFMAILLGAFFVVTLLNIYTATALGTRSFSLPVLLSLAYATFEAFMCSVQTMLPPALSTWAGYLLPHSLVALMLIFVLLIRSWFAEELQDRPLIRAFLQLSLWSSVAFPVAQHVIGKPFCDLYIGLQVIAYFVPILSGLLFTVRRNKNYKLFVVGYGVSAAVLGLYLFSIVSPVPTALIFAKIRIVAFLAMSSYFSASFSLGIQRLRMEHQLMRTGLKGFVADRHIERILSEGVVISGEPKIYDAAVMFVEVVGFSDAALRMDPSECFEIMKDALRQISEIVHRFDGVVDKSLSDGVLCFFASDYLGIGDQNVEARAISCAIELQRSNIARLLTDVNSTGKQPFPLRIGINTDRICIGNIGDDKRFDIALTGLGVIMAKRFEDACEPHRIMMGESTYHRLPPEILKREVFEQRFIQVKHSAAVEVSYECDPIARYRNEIGVGRVG